MLLKPDGKVFTRSWTWDGPTANVDLPAAAAALQPQSGEAYASLPSRGAGCDGCIGADTRARVSDAAAAAFPQTAIGAIRPPLSGRKTLLTRVPPQRARCLENC